MLVYDKILKWECDYDKWYLIDLVSIALCHWHR